MNKEIKTFYKLLLQKTFAFFGYTFFSMFVALEVLKLDKNLLERCLLILIVSFINSGLYFFTELYKYYGLQPDKKVLAKSQTKLYQFIL